MENESKRGKVYLVGAGPGDPGLFTIKGMELLRKADVVVYDRLASPRLLANAPHDAEFIYVGKRVGCHAVRQHEINEILVNKAREGKMVVRLKGGDPFIFGRGGEEAQVLAQNGIPFEIVPGVTSAISVPAYAGIPLTHRAYTASVALITGHRKMDENEAEVDWEGLAKGVGTLVFLMGMTNLPTITAKLMEFGRRPDTPAAVIRWGTTPKHRSVVGTLADIVEKVKEAGLKPPAIIVIGDVIALKPQLEWFEKRPLLGRRVAVTRTRSQASDLIRLLEEKGAWCIECPTIETIPLDDPAIDGALDRLSEYHWIVFTSANGVRYFMERLLASGRDIRALGPARLAVVGRATAELLKDYHLKADLIPEEFRAEGLVEAFRQESMEGRRVLIPRAKKAREVLPEALRSMGAEVEILPVYKTVPAELPALSREALEEGKVDAITFTSSSTVKNFMRHFPEALRDRIIQEAAVCAIGPVTADTCRRLGLEVSIMPEEATIPAMVRAIEAYLCGHTR